MSKWDKLIARICALSKDMRFDELRKVLERCMRPGAGAATAPSARRGASRSRSRSMSKKVYVEMVRQIVESEAKNDENAE